MSKYSILSRIIKKLPDGIAPIGEIFLNELKCSHKKRIRKILNDETAVTCKILRDEYQYSKEITDRKQKCFIRTDDGNYLKVIPSKEHYFLPLPLIFLTMNSLSLGSIAILGISVGIGIGIIILYSDISTNTKFFSHVEEETTISAEIGDYSGDELDDILSSDTQNKNEERYTIIDGIIYQGDYLPIEKEQSIPLGNNPENAKTDVLLEFIILEGNEEIFRSPKLEPGTGVNFIPSDYLEAGVHNLNIVIDVWHRDGQKDIGGNQVISIKIVD